MFLQREEEEARQVQGGGRGFSWSEKDLRKSLSPPREFLDERISVFQVKEDNSSSEKHRGDFKDGVAPGESLIRQAEMEEPRERSSSSLLREQEEIEGRSGFFQLLEDRENVALWQTEREVEEEEEELSPAFIKYLESTGEDSLTPAFHQYLGSIFHKDGTSMSSEETRSSVSPEAIWLSSSTMESTDNSLSEEEQEDDVSFIFIEQSRITHRWLLAPSPSLPAGTSPPGASGSGTRRYTRCCLRDPFPSQSASGAAIYPCTQPMNLLVPLLLPCQQRPVVG